MNKAQAYDAGYGFTGIYTRNKEEAKMRAAELRSKGDKAIVVTERDSEYSRGPRGTGYSVFSIESDENKAQREAEALASKIRNLKGRRQLLMEEVEKIDDDLLKLGYDINKGAACSGPCCA